MLTQTIFATHGLEKKWVSFICFFYFHIHCQEIWSVTNECFYWFLPVKHYLNLVLILWWKLINAPVAKQWSISLSCLPMANSGLEWLFSQMKLIKPTLCVCWEKIHWINFSVQITTCGRFGFGEWKADGALHLWLKEKVKRAEHKKMACW